MALDKSFLEEIDTAVDEAVQEMHTSQDGEVKGEEAKDEEIEDGKTQMEETEKEEEVKEEEAEVKEEEFAERELEEKELEEKEPEREREQEKSEKTTVLSDPAPRLDSVVERAIRAGFSLADAQAFPSDQALVSACQVIEQRQQETTEEKEEGEDPLAVFEKLNTDDFEPEVVEFLGTLVEQVRAQRDEIRELRSGHEQSAQAGQAMAAREVEEWFDGQVASLGDDFQEALGGGAYRALPQGSSQLAKRDAIADQMAVTIAGHQAMGRPVPPREELFQAAVKAVLRGEFAAVEQKQVQKKLRKLGKQHVPRSSKGEKAASSDVSPEDEVAAKLNEKYFKE